MWIREYREHMGLELFEFARIVNMYRRYAQLQMNGIISDKLIHMLEVDEMAITHPVLANAIATVCGATQEQRNGIVAPYNKCDWICPSDAETKRLIDRAFYMVMRRMPDEEKSDEGTNEGPSLAFKKRPVLKLDRMGNTLESYNSVQSAAIANKLSTKWVRNRCRKTIKDKRFIFTEDRNYTFRYADEWDEMSQAERLADIGVRQ